MLTEWGHSVSYAQLRFKENDSCLQILLSYEDFDAVCFTLESRHVNRWTKSTVKCLLECNEMDLRDAWRLGHFRRRCVSSWCYPAFCWIRLVVGSWARWGDASTETSDIASGYANCLNQNYRTMPDLWPHLGLLIHRVWARASTCLQVFPRWCCQVWDLFPCLILIASTLQVVIS